MQSLLCESTAAWHTAFDLLHLLAVKGAAKNMFSY